MNDLNKPSGCPVWLVVVRVMLVVIAAMSLVFALIAMFHPDSRDTPESAFLTLTVALAGLASSRP